MSTPDEVTTSEEGQSTRVDWMLSGTAFVCIVAACIPIFLFPTQSAEFTQLIYDWVSSHFGLLYQWMAIACLIVLVWIACSRYGSRRLGADTDEREYSAFAWMAMLFCAGIGAGLLYWSFIEWAFYMDKPLFGLEPESDQTAEWAATYGIFHWGISGWAIYCLPAVAIAYPYYRNNIPYLRLSTALVGFGNADIVSSPIGRIVDFLFILALIGGAGTSLGLGIPVIGAVLSSVIGVEQSFAMDLFVAFLAVVLFGLSVYFGLDKGIKRLSVINVWVALVFVGFVLVAGPTLFILETGTNSMGLMLQEFIRMNTWTDPIAGGSFVEDWTIFYWAWWLAYGPFMGLFVTRISRGRSLRELIFGMLVYGSLGCALFFIVLGNTSMWLDMNGEVAVRELVQSEQADTAIAETIAALSFGPLPMIAFLIMGWIFVATTYDSASYAISSAATTNLRVGMHPHRFHRVFWAFGLAVLPLGLMLIGDVENTSLKFASLIVSLPLLVIYGAMMWSLFKSLRADTNS